MACAFSGVGKSFTVTSVTTPSKPSDPVTRASKSYPGLSSPSEPISTISPSMVTNRTFKILLTVRPYFKQWTPPEFSATFPPMEQAI